MPKVKKASVPLCNVVGHDWRITTSDDVKVCMRKECRLVQQKIRGHWRYIRKINTMQLNKIKRGESAIHNDIQEVAKLWRDIT